MMASLYCGGDRARRLEDRDFVAQRHHVPAQQFQFILYRPAQFAHLGAHVTRGGRRQRRDGQWRGILATAATPEPRQPHGQDHSRQQRGGGPIDAGGE
ncbi:MAG: hypothetical protein MZW92_13355 [Comamonadaceae bacterium]|nr:hypothetical protein [Comamonadaceae bacterium]